MQKAEKSPLDYNAWVWTWESAKEEQTNETLHKNTSLEAPKISTKITNLFQRTDYIQIYIKNCAFPLE